MRVYKGFNKKIQAKHGKGTFQYEKGKTYKEEKSKTRSTGFHAAEYILDCLQWYPIDGKNKFFLCEAGGSIDEEDGCSMVVSTELTLLRELTLMEIAMVAMEYMIIHPKRTWEKRERGAYAEKERSKAIGETKIAIARGKHPEVKGEYGTVIGLIVEDEKGKPVAAGVRNVDGIQDLFHDRRKRMGGGAEMKRKAIERIKPKKPEGKGLTATLQELGKILILNIYQAKELLVRYCINCETGEHEYWKEQHGWRKGGILNALNEDWRDWEWRTYDDYPKLQKKDANRIKELIRHRAWNNSPWERINGLEHSYNSEIRERCETNRKMKLMNLMRKVPGRPKNLREWFFEQAAGEDYMFRNRETKEFVCTNCGESSWPEEIKRQDGEKKIRHNDMVFCPSCGKLVQAKTRTDHIEQKWKSCYLIQPVDEDTSVLRIIEAKVGWDNGRHYVELGDEIRILLYKVYSNRKLKKTYMIYYEDSWDGWTKGNRKNLRAREGYLYPGEFGQILDGTTYSEATRVLEHLSKTGMELNYNRLVAGTGQMKGYAQKIEYLAKGRFWNLLRDTIGCTDYPGYPTQYYGPLDMREESIEGMFRIQDRQKINRIRDEHGGNRMVRWMQYSDEAGQKISKETVQWMIKNEIEPSSIQGLEKYMSPQKIMNYIERQKKEQYAGMTAEAVLEEYKDYLSMCEACCKNMADEMVYRPRELKRRHDEVVVDRQQIQILKELENNAEGKEAYAQEMRQKFPEAEEILKEIKSRYEYEDEEYKIIVPNTLVDIVKEGRALHHCAGSSERYFDRIESRETYICFLRRQETPGIPFYTIEVEPGGTIRQHRSYYDEEPGIEEIRVFLKSWQKAIRKRLTEEDKKLAKISKIKREANIAELEEKKNIRVLQGLAEDFLEAEEIEKELEAV